MLASINTVAAQCTRPNCFIIWCRLAVHIGSHDTDASQSSLVKSLALAFNAKLLFNGETELSEKQQKGIKYVD